VCVQEPCVYLLSAASVVIRNKNDIAITKSLETLKKYAVKKNSILNSKILWFVLKKNSKNFLFSVLLMQKSLNGLYFRRG
jgi:hypothetical protein